MFFPAGIKNALGKYLNSIADTTQRGDAREESYYDALKSFLIEVAKILNNQEVQVTILPKKTEAGNPDFRIWDGSHRIIGYIEAKAPDTNLETIETSEQLQRYRQTFPNLILTDFYEFRLYRHGHLSRRMQVARPVIARLVQARPPAEQVGPFLELLEEFFSFVLPPSVTAEELAQALARRTRFLRDEVIFPELIQQIQTQQGRLYGFYKAFQDYLIADLSPEAFADLYAQTLTYGLFAARTRAQEKEPFRRQSARDLIPPTIGILRDVFEYISLGKSPSQLEALIDDIAAVLDAADVQAILEQYYKQGKGDDPILHFYETFLAEYDPDTRERRGVYYTPQPVVSYIVRSVHELLKSRFHLIDGLADKQVTLLDPAAGTLTFLAEALQVAFKEYTTKYGGGAKHRWLREHILPHFYAFELLMAPYAIGHIKISFLLQALGTPLQEGERFQLYLTNALELEDPKQGSLAGIDTLSEENQRAAQIKKQPILVILGNPPYSGLSANRNPIIDKLLKEDWDGAQSYYTVNGQPLGEKNPKWLQDDYVKFLRFAQWKIHRAGRGILAMITNHSYLDNPTFRGMRQSLLKTFDEIYILDLHGNSLKREKAPDGGPDENVFDIRQGVAIGIFIKHNDLQKRGFYYADLYGPRQTKYDWLNNHTLNTANYQPISPESPFYFFTPRLTQNSQTYSAWPSITEIFPANSVGIVTARDKLTIRWTPDEMWATVLRFSQLNEDLAREAFELGKDARDWKVSLAQQDVKREGGPHREKIVPILYRPFDVRYTYYTGRSRGFHCMPRPEVMRHMLAGENVALITHKREELDLPWAHALVTDLITEHGVLSSKTTNYHFPLYHYLPKDNKGKTELLGIPFEGRRPNLADWLLPKLSAAYGFTPTPEDVLAYIYAVLYSPTYRAKYAQELRTDFPRIPFTEAGAVFRRMAELGQRLIDVHLLRSPELDPPIAKYQGSGPNDTVERVRYDKAHQRVFINAEKYFSGITPDLWAYQIGGYQVLEKYLKDRKGRSLTLQEIEHYPKVVTAIERTIAIQSEIEAEYPTVEASLLEGSALLPTR